MKKENQSNIFDTIGKAIKNPELRTVFALAGANAAVQVGLPLLSNAVYPDTNPYTNWATLCGIAGATLTAAAKIGFDVTKSFGDTQIDLKKLFLNSALAGLIGHAGGQLAYHAGAAVLNIVEEQLKLGDHAISSAPANIQTPPPVILARHLN